MDLHSQKNSVQFCGSVMMQIKTENIKTLLQNVSTKDTDISAFKE